MHLPPFPRGATGQEPERGIPPPPPGEAEDETGVAPRWFRISVQPMPPDPRSGRKGALTVWQVDEITMDRAREEASFAKVQAAIAYLDSAPAGFFTADADGTIEYLNATLAQWLGLDLSEIAGRALKLEEIMSADSAALIARSGRGQELQALPAASTSIWSRQTAPAFPCASCIACLAPDRAEPWRTRSS